MIYAPTDQGFLSLKMQMLEFHQRGTDFFKTDIHGKHF